MSDSIWDWAEDEVDGLRINGKPLDLAHLSALAVVAHRRADLLVQEREGWAQPVRSVWPDPGMPGTVEARSR